MVVVVAVAAHHLDVVDVVPVGDRLGVDLDPHLEYGDVGDVGCEIRGCHTAAAIGRPPANEAA